MTQTIWTPTYLFCVVTVSERTSRSPAQWHRPLAVRTPDGLWFAAVRPPTSPSPSLALYCLQLIVLSVRPVLSTTRRCLRKLSRHPDVKIYRMMPGPHIKTHWSHLPRPPRLRVHSQHKRLADDACSLLYIYIFYRGELIIDYVGIDGPRRRALLDSGRITSSAFTLLSGTPIDRPAILPRAIIRPLGS